METIKITKAFELTSPNPVTLACTENSEGKTNLAAVSWWMYLSINPSLLCFAMMKPSYSGEMIRQNKKVILAMPSVEIAAAAFKCGTVSGRNVDKAAKFGIELANLSNNSIKVPVYTRLVFACSLNNTIEAGDHYLYICAIDEIFADESKEQIFAWDGYSKLEPLS